MSLLLSKTYASLAFLKPDSTVTTIYSFRNPAIRYQMRISSTCDRGSCVFTFRQLWSQCKPADSCSCLWYLSNANAESERDGGGHFSSCYSVLSLQCCCDAAESHLPAVTIITDGPHVQWSFLTYGPHGQPSELAAAYIHRFGGAARVQPAMNKEVLYGMLQTWSIPVYCSTSLSLGDSLRCRAYATSVMARRGVEVT